VNRFFRSALFPLIVIVLLVYLASQTLLNDRGDTRPLTYSELIREVQNGNVNEVLFNPRPQSISGKLVTGEEFKVNYPTPQSATSFQNLLTAENVPFD
jgi:cell division protease FtsH